MTKQKASGYRFGTWLAIAFLAFVVIVALLVWNNNYSLHQIPRSEFSAQLDRSIASSTDWILKHPEVQGNPPLMFMVEDMQEMSSNPQLRAFVDQYLASRRVRVPGSPITWYYARMADPHATVPMLVEGEAERINWEDRWNAYGMAPDRVQLSAADRSDMFSPTKYNWGTRLHIQLLALDMYRHFNGTSPELDRAINPVAEGVANDAYWDFRVSDSYYQRNAFILGAGRPDLIRSRWIERILDRQHPDGSWSYCWYGWCRGVFEFSLTKNDPSHSTVQAAWALYMLKYRYSQWVDQHYP